MALNQALKIPYVELRYVIKMAVRRLLSSFGFSLATSPRIHCYNRRGQQCQAFVSSAPAPDSLCRYARRRFPTYKRSALVCQALVSLPPSLCSFVASAGTVIAKIYFRARGKFVCFGIDCATRALAFAFVSPRVKITRYYLSDHFGMTNWNGKTKVVKPIQVVIPKWPDQ